MNNNIRKPLIGSGIYKITNLINGKIYIGQSIECSNRRRSHLSDLRNGKHGNQYLQSSWLKYGEKNFIIEMIHKCHQEELDEWEIHYIEKHDSLNRKNGYNLREGGGNSPLSEESIQKISKTKLSKKLHRGETNANALFSNETAEKIILDVLSGLSRECVTEKYCIPMSSVNGLVQNRTYIDILPHLREDLKNLDKKSFENRKRKVIELYKEGYPQNQISKMLKISRNTIRKELEKNGLETNIHKNQGVFGKLHPLSKPVVQLTKDWEYVNEFEYIKEAGEKTGLSKDYISICCKDSTKSCGGFKWMYKEEYEKLKSAN